MTSEQDIFDPYDLDREEFNPDMCMQRYAREFSFPNLLAKKTHLDREINDVKSQMQNLLYDNYRKIDKISSVIGNMKADFQETEENMNDLQNKMSVIGDTASSVSKIFQPVEYKMGDLLKMQDSVKKLSFLTDLVPTLKMHVDLRGYSTAARYYLKVEKLLKIYSYSPLLSGIFQECLNIVAEIKLGLLNQLNCEMCGKYELSDTLNLLLALEEAPEVLLKRFLNCGEKCLADLLTLMNELWTKDSLEKNNEHVLHLVNKYMSYCCSYLEKMFNVLMVAKNVFGVWLEEFFFQNMDHLRTSLLYHITENFQHIDDELLPQALDTFIRECYKHGIIKSYINFHSQGLDIVLKICTLRCEAYLEKMTEDFNMRLIEQVEELSSKKNITKLVSFFTEWTEQKLMSVLELGIQYIRPEFRCCREALFRKIFCKSVVREGTFVAFLRHVIAQSWKFLQDENIECVLKPLLCMFLVKFLLNLSDVVPQCMLEIDDCLYCPDDNSSVTSSESMIAELKNMALKMVDFYVCIRCQTIKRMIQKSMENRDWMASKEPTRPRAVIKMILNELLEAKLETEKVFGACKNFDVKRSSSGSASFLENKGKSKQSLIEEKVLLNKLFVECSQESTRIELSSSSVINSLLKDTLKTFIQLIRLKTLNHFSLQQIQVEVFYLQQHLSQHIELDLIVQSLFDELMASACNRTVNPQFMSDQIVSAICSDVL